MVKYLFGRISVTLTTEQLAFKDDRKLIEATVSGINDNYLIPFIEEEKRIIEEYEDNPLGKMGCLGAFFGGILLPVFITASGVLVIDKWYIQCSIGKWLGIIVLAVAFSLFEYFTIVLKKNREFRSAHKDITPKHLVVTEELVLPLLGGLGMDINDEEKLKLKVDFRGTEAARNMVSTKALREMNKVRKRGQTYYSGELLELSANLADKSKLDLTVNEFISVVKVFKKRGPSKRNRKEKTTIKAVLSFPTKLYSALKEGSCNIDENTVAQITPSEKHIKIVVKKSLAMESNSDVDSKLVSYESIVNGCYDAIGKAYSLIGAQKR